MKNNSQFPVYQVHCCLPRRGKSGEKEVLRRDHEFGFRGRKLKESLLAVSAVLMRVGPGWLEGSTPVAEGPVEAGCESEVAPSQVAGGFSCRTQQEEAEGWQGSRDVEERPVWKSLSSDRNVKNVNWEEESKRLGEKGSPGGHLGA